MPKSHILRWWILLPFTTLLRTYDIPGIIPKHWWKRSHLIPQPAQEALVLTNPALQDKIVPQTTSLKRLKVDTWLGQGSNVVGIKPPRTAGQMCEEKEQRRVISFSADCSSIPVSSSWQWMLGSVCSHGAGSTGFAGTLGFKSWLCSSLTVWLWAKSVHLWALVSSSVKGSDNNLPSGLLWDSIQIKVC